MNRRSFFKGLAALAVIPNALMTGVAKAKVACKPLMFGRVLNVPVDAIANDSLIYRVNAGSVQSIEAIRDGGMELPIHGDDPDIETLRRSRIRPGYSRTCVAEGIFRLGAVPVFPITVDAIGTEIRPRVTRMDELAGAVRDSAYSREWLYQIDAQGLLVHTWG